MQTRSRRLTVLTLVAALGLAGCADGAGESTADAPSTEAETLDEVPTADPAAETDVLAAIEQRCVETNEEVAAVEEAHPGETPEDAVGFLTGFADAIDGFTGDVRELEVPADAVAGHAHLMTTLDGIAATMRGAVDRIESGEEDIEAVVGPVFGTLGEADGAAQELYGFTLSGCGAKEVVADPDATRVAVTATDHTFEIPEVSAGATAFTMTNEGDEPHFMYVVRLKEGASLDEALAAEQAGGDPEAFIEEEVGESATVDPGGEAVLNADLTPGTYAMLCFVSTEDGTPHAALGMAQEFTVA